MNNITFELDQQQLQRTERDLNGLGVKMPKILSRVANKTATSARVALVKELQGAYTEKSGKAKRSMKIKKASNSSPTAVIEVTGKPQPSVYFHYSKGGKGGAKLQVRTDKPFAAVVSKRGGRKAFVAQMASGHKGVFQRQAGEYMDKSPRLSRPNVNKKTQHTEEIKELFSPSSVKMVEVIYDGSSGNLAGGMEEEIGALFQKYLKQQIDLALEKR